VVEAAPAPKRRLYSAGAAFAAYTALAFALFANVWTSPASRWIGVDGDPDSTIWSVEWSAYALIHHLDPFATNYIFYPSGTNVLWANADAPIALAWAAVPVTLAFGPIVAYNLLQTLALSLSAWAAFLAIRWYVNLFPAAVVGGLVYGFGPYMMGQAYGHMALTFGVIPPLLVLLIDRLVVRRHVSPLLIGALAGVLEAFQLLVSEELVVTEAIVVILGLALLAVVAIVFRWHVEWQEELRRLAVAGGAAAVVFSILAAYPIYLLLRGPARITHEPIRAFGTYVTDVYNIVIPPDAIHLIHNAWTVDLSKAFPGSPVESGGYLGIGLVAVIVFTTLRWWRIPLVVFSAAMLAVILLISLGPALTHEGRQSTHILLPWSLARNLPLLNEILVERMSLYVDLFAGLLLAFFIEASWHSRLRFARPAAAVATAGSLALLVPSLPWVASTAHVPAIFQPGTDVNRTFEAAVPDGSVAVVLPAGNLKPGTGYAVLWQAVDRMKFRMPEGDLVHGDTNGVATNDPVPSPLWTAISQLQAGKAPPSEPADFDDVRAQLQSFGVRAVIVGPMDNQELAVEYFSRLLRKPPTDTGGVYIWPLP
jgi:hypothetical protein